LRDELQGHQRHRPDAAVGDRTLPLRRSATMIRALALAIAAVATVAPAAAQSTGPSAIPTLKRAVVVTSDLVRIGDLVDNAGAASDTAIFRAPDIGTAGSVTTDQVLQ